MPAKLFTPYIYIKKPPTLKVDQRSAMKSKLINRRAKQIVPTSLITLGSIVIANALWPILSYQLFVAPKIRKVEFISPLAADYQQVGFEESSFANMPIVPQVLGVDLDYTNARTWFPEADFFVNNENKSEYTIHIPSLDIEEAKVIIGGDDLDEGLIHYPGTSIPGQLGSPVIFGHSVLRQFYNPSINNPDRYVSIFSKLMTLKNGDEIIIDYDGIKYFYEVKDKVEVQPEDIFILEQRYNNRQLKLITCVPEGTYLRRGVVIAQLVDVN